VLKSSAILAGFLLISSIEASEAAPGNSPDIVYVDGQPCNRACQSYLAWLYRTPNQSVPVSSQPVAAQQPTANLRRKPGKKPKNPVLARTVKPEGRQPIKNASQGSAVRADAQSATSRTTALSATTPKSHPRTNGGSVIATAPTRQEATPVVPLSEPINSPPDEGFRSKTDSGHAPNQLVIPPVQDLSTDVQLHGTTATAQDPAAANSLSDLGNARGPIATAPTVEGPTTENANPKLNSASTESSAPPDAARPAETNAAALVLPNAGRVAVLFVRPEIKSIRDLARKVVAIDDPDSLATVKAAMESEGAAEVRLSEDEKLALVRVMDGDVAAAVVAVGSAEMAAKWTGVPGFSVLQLPLAPPPIKDGRR
jgi:hypothetical protein